MAKNAKTLAAAVLAIAAATAHGAAVDASAAATVAVNFIRRDAAGALLLAGRTVGAVQSRGDLWAVALKPSGYVIVAADDASRPVIAFSAEGSADVGDGENAFAAMLRTESEGVARASVASVVRSSSMLTATALTAASSGAAERRAQRWRELLNASEAYGRMTFAMASPQPDAVLKAPMLTTKWSQWQPYNDLAPVYSQTDGAYRGRMPSGCVATAYAQVLNYWRWPVAFAGSVENVHSVSGTGVGEMRYRVDGDVEFGYAGMLDEYPNYSNGYDLRGKVDERVRYGVARLVQYAGVLARMQYGKNGSAAQLDAPCKNNMFYEFGRNIGNSTLAGENFASLRDSVMAGIPALIGVPGHAIVADGWAEDGSGNAYVHFNYGWGGGSDGYYTLDETDTQSASKGYIVYAITGHKPKNMAVLEKPKGVSGLPFTLSWRMPACHDGSVGSIAVKYVSFNENITEFRDDFSSSPGTSSHPDQIYATAPTSYDGRTSEVLRFGTRSAGEYAYARQFRLTGRSRVSYRVLSNYALGMNVALQMRTDGGNWETIDAPALVPSGYSIWKWRNVFLGQHAGKTVNFRWAATWSGNSYSTTEVQFGTFVDDFAVEGVQEAEEGVKIVAGDSRSATFDAGELAAGKSYSFTVLAEGGSESAPVVTRIAGRYREPLACEEEREVADLVFSDADERWALRSETPYDGELWLGPFSSQLRADVSQFTAESRLRFDFFNRGYYGTGYYDEIQLVFRGEDETETVVSNFTLTAQNAAIRSVDCDFGEFAGRRGTAITRFKRTGGQYTDQKYGICLTDVRVTNVSGPKRTASPVLWSGWRDATELPRPEITAVTALSGALKPVTEGFYRECSRGTNVLLVACSEGVAELEARSGNLTLVPDDRMAVHRIGAGRFAVVLDARAVTSQLNRSRVIVTLKARDANGSEEVKDVVLRFSDEGEAENFTPPPKETSGGEGTQGVRVPYAWLVANGLAADGDSAETMEAAAQADGDGDGFANWQEYVCGTDPNDAKDKFEVYVRVDGGKVTIEWSVTNAPFAKYVVEGKRNLDDAQWSQFGSGDADFGDCRFFRVVVGENPR